MRKFFMSVAALQFVLAAATVQPVSIATATQSLSIDELSKIAAISTIETAEMPILIDISFASDIVVLPDTALQELPASLAESGIASFYSGGLTANGENALASGMTAAHRSLPFGTKVRVTNGKNGRSVVVRINDRGPFITGRVIDLTLAGAQALDFSGLAPVTLVLERDGK
jgi:rare lipoprotein A